MDKAVYEAITMAAFLLLLLELTMAKERDQGKNWNDLMKEKGHQPLMWVHISVLKSKAV